ncbi:MAG: HD domain-containing protein [Chitinophagales bacterium]
MTTLESIKANPTFQKYLEMGNEYIGTIGAIEHNFSHAELVSSLSYQILYKLGFPRREAELAAIAGYLHDIGNIINRYEHGMSGALIVFEILLEIGMNPEEICTVMGAVANHEEHAGGNAVNNVAAAVILADKSDVQRSRVRKVETSTFTTRDRVNYAAQESNLVVDEDNHTISMSLTIDNGVCSVMDYFEIFMTKMLLCKRAAEFLDCRFELLINDVRLL